MNITHFVTMGAGPASRRLLVATMEPGGCWAIIDVYRALLEAV